MIHVRHDYSQENFPEKCTFEKLLLQVKKIDRFLLTVLEQVNEILLVISTSNIFLLKK